MDAVQRIAKNTFVLFAANVINMVLGFFYGVYTARYLGAENYGTLALAIAFISLFTVFTDFGLQQLTVREVARDKTLAVKYLSNIAFLKLFLVALAYGLIVISVNLLGYPAFTIQVIYLMALSMVFGAFVGMFTSVFQAFEKMEYASFGSILNNVLMLAGALFAISHGLNVMTFAAIYLMSSALVLTYTVAIAIWLGLWPHREYDFTFMKDLFKRALPFGIGSLFLIYYLWIDRVIISIMLNDTMVGYYSAAYNLINVLSFIPNAFVVSLFPIMANYFTKSDKSLNTIYRISIKYMYMLALPIVIGTTLLGPNIIELIYGAGFLPSVQPLKILIWAEFFVYIDVLLGQMLYSINKERVIMIYAGMGAALNIILNLLLITRFGLAGAAAATLATEFSFFIIAYYVLSKSGYKINWRSMLPKPIISTIVMGIFIIKFIYVPIIILIPISVVIYFISLYATKYISDEDWALARQVASVKMGGLSYKRNG
jgi:O-antigen/teichoic acid export membrane protein